MSEVPEPFTLRVGDEDLADLAQRLARTRFPDQAPGEPWAYGTDLDYMRGLVAYWRDGFDWRAAEARLNAFPQFKVPLHGIGVHFLHVPGRGPAPLPLPGPFPTEAQRQVGLRFMKALGFDFNHGRLDVSLHPFTGPVLDQAGTQRLAPGAVMDDATLGKMDYFVQGVSSRLPNAR